MLESVLETVIELGPNAVYVILMVGVWLAITGIYAPGTGIVELFAIGTLAIGAIGLFALEGQVLGLALLFVSLVCFLVLIFYRRFWQLVVLGGLLQLFGSFFLFPPDTRPSILAIVLTTAATLIYHEFILRPGLKTLSQPAWLDDETLVGKEAVVTRTLDPHGMIRVEGELWRASVEGHEMVEAGEVVVVTARKGLELQVALPGTEVDQAA